MTRLEITSLGANIGTTLGVRAGTNPTAGTPYR
jgi:hypothetical protein